MLAIIGHPTLELEGASSRACHVVSIATTFFPDRDRAYRPETKSQAKLFNTKSIGFLTQ